MNDIFSQIVIHIKRKICLTLAVMMAVCCVLSGCGPEPGESEEAASLFGGGGGPGAGMTAGMTPGGNQGDVRPPGEGREDAASGSATLSAPVSAENPAGTSEQAAAAPEPGRPGKYPADLEAMSAENLNALQNDLNEKSNYGFLLSTYETPADINLSQVFYCGAGFKQEELEKKERKLLFDRIDEKNTSTPVFKVTDEQIDDLLARKAGITYEESSRKLDGEESWAHIGRYGAWYSVHRDSNQKYIQCSDAWTGGDICVVHYVLTDDFPADITPAQEKGSSEEKTETAGTASSSATADEEGTSAAEGDTSGKAAGQETASADKKAAGQETAAAEQKSAGYKPVYEAILRKKGDGWQFCSNILWVQKGLIEAQSYRAELDPVGEIFFAPVYPDTGTDPMADVSFALIRDKGLAAVLDGMEKDNIRTDRIFKNVDSVDFTDYNNDGCTDILTVCTYTKVGKDGKKSGELTEARVYTGQLEGTPFLDEKKTKAVNRDVETINISNITSYLTGKTDGKDKKYSSWKEAYADHIRNLDEKEYDGFALIYLNDDRVPELVQVGATSAKGATVVIYRSGILNETWLNRRDFRYLEYENLLLSASGVENLHFDTIYSISGGKLSVSVQGYYGNDSFAQVQYDDRGRESYDYTWDGGRVSRSGYLDGISFVFDMSRAKSSEEEQLLSAEEILEKLK